MTIHDNRKPKTKNPKFNYMNRFLSFFIIFALCFIAGGESLSAKDKAENKVVVYALTPAPSCQNCVKKIKENLRFEKGVKDIDVDLEKKSVSLTYSPKDTNEENLVKALKKIGYTATPYDGKAKSCCGGCCGSTESKDDCCKSN